MKLTADILSGFVGSVLAHRFDESVASPDFHYELWQLACSDDRYISVAAPRGHAKTTAGTISYGLASVLFRTSHYCIIVSDTETQAAMFLSNIKEELETNDAIKELFGLKLDKNGIPAYITNNETEIVVPFEDGHKFRISAKGAGQSMRGMLWVNKRPDLMIIDDLENDDLVLNKERRDKLYHWFTGALMPLLSVRGKMRMWGTILHMDSLLERTMPSETDPRTVIEDLKIWTTKKSLWKAVKYKAHNEDFSKLLWGARYSKEYFVALREEAAKQGTLDVYSREYLNTPTDESVAFFKKKDLLGMKKEDFERRKTYYITADLAISEKERADYSVFVVGGMDEFRNLHIEAVIRDRLDGREIVETILSLQSIYEPAAFGVEEMQVSKAIGPFLREEMIKRNIFPNFLLLKHQGKDKIQRATSIRARIRARTVKFNNEADWYPVFEDEVLKFPRARHDDQVDALAYLGLLLDKQIEAQSDEEIEEEEYLDELKRTGPSTRNLWTGY